MNELKLEGSLIMQEEELSVKVSAETLEKRMGMNLLAVLRTSCHDEMQLVDTFDPLSDTTYDAEIEFSKKSELLQRLVANFSKDTNLANVCEYLERVMHIDIADLSQRLMYDSKTLSISEEVKNEYRDDYGYKFHY